MTSLPLITVIIFLYLYIPSILFRYGISKRYRLSKITNDNLEISAVYFITRCLFPISINILLSMYVITPDTYRLDIIPLVMSGDDASKEIILKTLNASNYWLITLHLFVMYLTTYLSSYLFRIWQKDIIKSDDVVITKLRKHFLNSIKFLLQPPLEGLKAIEKYLLLYKNTTPVDILTDANILYSGNFVEIIHNKEDQPSIVVIENPTKCYIFKSDNQNENNFLEDSEIKANKKKFESDKLMINFSKIVNMNFTNKKSDTVDISENFIVKEQKYFFEDIEKELTRIFEESKL